MLLNMRRPIDEHTCSERTFEISPLEIEDGLDEYYLSMVHECVHVSFIGEGGEILVLQTSTHKFKAGKVNTRLST